MTEFTPEEKINFLMAIDIINIQDSIKNTNYEFVCSVLSGKNPNYTPYSRMSTEALNERFDIIYNNRNHFKNTVKIHKLTRDLNLLCKPKGDVSNETKA
jgi:hypothetical protein